jgi:F-type H+-transporting ATPase subunit epsilon
MSITFSLISQDKVVDELEADEVLLPTTNGQIGILPNHVDLITTIQTGEITIKSHGKESHYAVFGGFAEITGKEVTVLADRAEHADSIDLAAAEQAHRNAEAMLKDAKDDQELSHALGLIERNLNRIDIVKRRRHTSHHKTPESLQ